jgi:hypothetical protein
MGEKENYNHDAEWIHLARWLRRQFAAGTQIRLERQRFRRIGI